MLFAIEKDLNANPIGDCSSLVLPDSFWQVVVHFRFNAAAGTSVSVHKLAALNHHHSLRRPVGYNGGFAVLIYSDKHNNANEGFGLL